MPKAALMMGSKSDWPSLKGCVDVLKGLGVEVEVHVASAHRTPEKVAAFASHARDRGFEVILAAAGKAAHLAGVIAGHTTLPGHRHPDEILADGRAGFASFHRSDAHGHPGGDGCRGRRGECGLPGRTDPVHQISGTGRKN